MQSVWVMRVLPMEPSFLTASEYLLSSFCTKLGILLGNRPVQMRSNPAHGSSSLTVMSVNCTGWSTPWRDPKWTVHNQRLQALINILLDWARGKNVVILKHHLNLTLTVSQACQIGPSNELQPLLLSLHTTRVGWQLLELLVAQAAKANLLAVLQGVVRHPVQQDDRILLHSPVLLSVSARIKQMQTHTHTLNTSMVKTQYIILSWNPHENPMPMEGFGHGTWITSYF